MQWVTFGAFVAAFLAFAVWSYAKAYNRKPTRLSPAEVASRPIAAWTVPVGPGPLVNSGPWGYLTPEAEERRHREFEWVLRTAVDLGERPGAAFNWLGEFYQLRRDAQNKVVITTLVRTARHPEAPPA